MFIKKIFILVINIFIFNQITFAYWQQKVDYEIEVDVDDTTHKLNGTENIIYYNNSSDTLKNFYLHLYWNAFQPNSSMDINSRLIKDSDPRVLDRIFNLKPNEIGYQKIDKILLNGVKVDFIIHETILEILLTKNILPNSKTNITIIFESQIPLQIRRCGRFNKENIQYSIAQWYPKVCAYDIRGWHTNQYIAREFYGEWGDFNVSILINKKFIVAATGILNDDNIKGNKKLWNFKANNVHDFVWAADSNYTHTTKTILPNKLELNFYYKPKDENDKKKWKDFEDTLVKIYPLIEKLLGAYPYNKYSFIQGGDGGMEYPMATLIKSNNISTAIHEWIHSWFQGMLANNESDYGWLDEGFTNFYEDYVSKTLQNKINDLMKSENKYYLMLKDNEEPMNTHSDYFKTNANYRNGSYTKGALLLNQLGYIVGDSVRDFIIKQYISKWKFKHPQPNDFFQVAESVSGIQLKWFQNFWVNTTKKIDYSIKKINKLDSSYEIILERIGDHIMPIDLEITYTDGSKEQHYIPLDLMLKPKEKNTNNEYILHNNWKSVSKEYKLIIPSKLTIYSVTIDPKNKMSDINSSNNVLLFN